MNESAYDRVAARLVDVTGYMPAGTNGSRMFRCPGHDDKKPSLSVTQATDKVLVKCQAGCETSAVLAALKLEASDLFDEKRKASSGTQTVDTYDYVDEAGELLFQVLRKPNKDFPQRRRDGKGGWVWKLDGVRRVLYRLPRVIEEVAAGATIFIAEGEKDVHALERQDCVATCNPGGAGKWRDEYADVLVGAVEVVIVRDKDPAGIKHAADVEASIRRRNIPYRVVEALSGKDAFDHLAEGHGVDEFQLVDAVDATISHPQTCIDWASFWAKDRRDADWLFEDVLARGRGHSLFAGHKVGKSLLMLWLALQLITAGVVIVYLDYEMGEDDLYDRLSDMGYGPETDLSRLRYYLLPSISPLDTAKGADELVAILDDVSSAFEGAQIAVIIDTTGRAVEGEENSADTIRAFYRWTGLRLKQRGVTWARLDHAGKDATKGQRGSSAKGDDVDVVWRLAKTEDGLELRREAARMGWVPERVAFHLRTDPLSFVRVASAWPAGTGEIAKLLESLDVPLEAGERPAGAALREAGHKATQAVVRAAQRYRREQALEGLT